MGAFTGRKKASGRSVYTGAAAASDSSVAYLLAGLIALQNMPEGFAAYHEMHEGAKSQRRLWMIFLSIEQAQMRKEHDHEQKE